MSCDKHKPGAPERGSEAFMQGLVAQRAAWVADREASLQQWRAEKATGALTNDMIGIGDIVHDARKPSKQGVVVAYSTGHCRAVTPNTHTHGRTRCYGQMAH